MVCIKNMVKLAWVDFASLDWFPNDLEKDLLQNNVMIVNACSLGQGISIT